MHHLCIHEKITTMLLFYCVYTFMWAKSSITAREKKYILFQPSWLQVKRTGRVVLLVGAFRLPRPFRSLPGLNIRDNPNA